MPAKLLAQDVVPKHLQLLPSQSTLTCLSVDGQPRANAFTPNPFQKSLWQALSDTVRLDFRLSDSISKGWDGEAHWLNNCRAKIPRFPAQIPKVNLPLPRRVPSSAASLDSYHNCFQVHRSIKVVPEAGTRTYDRSHPIQLP